MPLHPDKQELRTSQLNRLINLPESLRNSLCQSLTAVLQTWLKRHHPNAVVGFFHPLADEPDLLPLASHWISSGQIACFPKTEPTNSHLRWFEVTHLNQLSKGNYGILEPNPHLCKEHPINSIHIILIPGLAFVAHSGLRLGRGGGFYDHALQKARSSPPCPLTVGIALPDHLLPSIPHLPHDQPMDFIATINSVVQCSNK